MLSLLGSLRRGNFISNSLRFRSSASASLSRTFATPTSSTVFTWSAWVKRGALGVTARLFGASTTTSFGFNSSDSLLLTLNGVAAVTTTAVYRDPSAWYHIVYTQNGAAQTVYVNGSSVGTGTTANTVFNTAVSHQIAAANSTNYFDGYLTEVNFIDGQALTPSSFGQIESTTGVWSPKQYVGSYGINGFYLKFGNTASVAALGTDRSGNGNTWTVNNVSLTAGVTYDSMLDVPANYSDSGNGRGNYAVLNPLDKVTTGTLAAANLETTSAAAQNIIASMSMDSGSWYWEISFSAATASQLVGVYKTTATTASITPTTSVIGLRFNADTGALDYTVNGSAYTSIATGLTGGGYFPYAGSLTNAKIIYANFGQRPFSYTPPTGFRALNTNNLSTPSIVNGANFMAATTYTGNAAARSLSNAVNNVSFQPNLVWIKSRTPAATSHALFDSTRGTTKYLSSDTTATETTLAQSLTAFGVDGFSLGTDTTLVNANANSYVAWQWRAGTGTVTNTSGTITSQVNANTTDGFSIVTYTGTGTNNPTIGHGLGAVPAMIILKSRDAAPTNWFAYHKDTGAGYYLFLNTSDSRNLISATVQGAIGTSPSSSVFTFAAGSTNSANGNSVGINYVAYCFSEVAGFSKFGSYSGNASADGPFLFCGFRPRFVMIKSVGSATNWRIIDTSRDTGNLSNDELYPNSSIAEVVFGGIDILSNGFKLRTSDVLLNASATTFIFAAFAENPTKYALAR
jgi:hypothetical protein